MRGKVAAGRFFEVSGDGAGVGGDASPKRLLSQQSAERSPNQAVSGLSQVLLGYLFLTLET